MAASSDPSAWRNFQEPRILTRPIGRPRKNGKLNMFYGYRRSSSPSGAASPAPPLTPGRPAP